MNNNLNIKEHFRTPEGYFDEVYGNIMTQIDAMSTDADKAATTEEKGRRARFVTLMWRMTAAAAVAAVIVLSATKLLVGEETDVAENTVADSSMTSVQSQPMIAEAVPAAADVVAVADEPIAEVQKKTVVHKPLRRPAKRKAVKASVTAHDAADFAADKVDEYLMIDAQMLHQMMITEL